MARRLQAMGQKNYANGFELTLQDQAVELPLRWKKLPRRHRRDSGLLQPSLPVPPPLNPISVYLKLRVGVFVAQALLLAASTLVSRADLGRSGRIETSLDAAD
jgi:hypothetical protein